MPTPVFEFDLNPNTNAVMQDLAWDPWTWEVFCGQFTTGTISPPRQTAVLTRCAPPDDANHCNEISVMKLLDAGHGHMIGFQRRKSELWLWQNWTRWMPDGSRKFYLVRFRWRSRVEPYTWQDPPLDMQVMASFHNDQTVVYAQLDPLGEYIAYRVGGGGYDRFELRTIGEVERGIDRVLHRAGPFPTTRDTAQAAGWPDRYTVQGFATVGGRLWRYTGDGTGTNRSDPAALTEYDWKNGDQVARHNEPKDTGYLGPGTRWEPEGLTIARTAPDQIRVLWGVARGPTSNREFLIYSFAYPLKTS
jgi:Phage 5-bladed beta propeller receptor binding platform domain